jgi:2-oxoglutarate ferredoxin oxidoreductase subunit gamma
VAPATRGTGRWEVRLAGNGGQGLVLAGIVLAEAAGLFEGAHVVQTQIYGPESRGGASRADVIIDRAAIDYPKVTAPGAMLVMSADGWTRYGASVRPGGTVIYDEDLVAPDGALGRQLIGLPLTAVARDRLGRAIVANVVGLAALAAATGVVSRAALEQAVLRRVPAASAPLNRAAVAAGWTLAAEAGMAAATATCDTA